MNIQSVSYKNNNTNFGVNFINKPKWNKEILNTLEKSELVKDMDRKYPNAFMKYSNHNLGNPNLRDCGSEFLASLIVGLDKNKVTAYNVTKPLSDEADKALNKYVSGLSLSDIEQRATEAIVRQSYSIEPQPVKQKNTIKSFMTKIFG